MPSRSRIGKRGAVRPMSSGPTFVSPLRPLLDCETSLCYPQGQQQGYTLRLGTGAAQVSPLWEKNGFREGNCLCQQKPSFSRWASSKAYFCRSGLPGRRRAHLNPTDNPAAAWSGDPTLNTVICAAGGDQVRPIAVGDGYSGTIIVWQDGRASSQDIYAQRLDPTGTCSGLTSGVAVCTASSDQARRWPSATAMAGRLLPGRIAAVRGGTYTLSGWTRQAPYCGQITGFPSAPPL